MKVNIQTSITPWLSVHNSKQAVEFYKRAFGASQTYNMVADDNSVIARLSIDGAEFWVSEAGEDWQLTHGNIVRMILIVSDPDALFNKAIEAGATIIFPVGEEHGWRLGRLEDPYGHHWEIGYEVN